jgi:outer membrane protein assembly factor BamB
VSPAALNAAGLTQRWVYASRMPVLAAWPGPDKRDYSNSPTVDNEDRLDLDSVYHVAVVGDSLFFGSSGEDALRCLDARTGETRWVHPTDGPVRFAPHVVEGKVYFGSDDGYIYCVRATDGSLVWRYRAAPSGYLVPSNGKLISLWPSRTGVVVQDGIVYCGAGIFPGEGVYVCALDALTGSDSGPGLFRQRFTDLSLQGYVLTSPEHLYFPGGRASPWVFDRRTGERRGEVGGGGGAYALLTGDWSIIYGPGRTSAVLEEFASDGRDRLASFPGAKHIVVTPERSYACTRDKVFALDRARYVQLSGELAKLSAQLKQAEQGSPAHQQLSAQIAKLEGDRQACLVWTVPCAYPEALILAGDYLIAGGADLVAAFRATDGTQVWSAPVDGLAKGLAAARGRLFVSSTTRRIHCFE